MDKPLGQKTKVTPFPLTLYGMKILILLSFKGFKHSFYWNDQAQNTSRLNGSMNFLKISRYHIQNERCVNTRRVAVGIELRHLRNFGRTQEGVGRGALRRALQPYLPLWPSIQPYPSSSSSSILSSLHPSQLPSSLHPLSTPKPGFDLLSPVRTHTHTQMHTHAQDTTRGTLKTSGPKCSPKSIPLLTKSGERGD